MKIAIHQPNFFPYMGFFQKMDSVDVFCIMVNCQFEKNNYQNRFKHLDRWFTMSVSKSIEKINEKEYINPDYDWSKIKKGLNKDLSRFDKCVSKSLYQTNVNLIKSLASNLGINTPIVYDYETELKGTERLIDICKRYNADEYLSGIGGKNYLDESLFTDIKLEYQTDIDKRSVIELL